MSPAREWMYKMDTIEFYEGIEDFIKQADRFFRSLGFTDATIKCPCKRCKHLEWKGYEDVKYDLYRYGFIHDYYVWTSHGEQHEQVQIPVRVEAANLANNMVIDLAGPDFHHLEVNDSFLEAQNIQSPNPPNPPNPEAKKIHHLLSRGDEPLYEGCKKYSTLAVVSRLLNIKSDFNMSENCYNRIMEALNDFFPDSKLCSSYYDEGSGVDEFILRGNNMDEPSVSSSNNPGSAHLESMLELQQTQLVLLREKQDRLRSTQEEHRQSWTMLLISNHRLRKT